jgi:hypothetical protein
MNAEINKIQIEVYLQGRSTRKARYRSMLPSGEWASTWHGMTMTDAKRALRLGVAHVGLIPECEVVALGPDAQWFVDRAVREGKRLAPV